MRRIQLMLLGAVSLLALNSIASAADLPVRKAPPLPPPPAWSWTGFYLGVHVGAGWSTTESEIDSITIGAIPATLTGFVLPISSHNSNGFLAGGQIGYNWQIAWAVFGFEADAAWTDIKGKAPCLLVFSCSTDHDWLVTVAGRFGVTWDRTMLYVKGGVAWSDTDYAANLALGPLGITAAVNDTRFGVLFGAGIEQGIAGGWSAKIEYNFIDFDTEDYNVPVGINLAPAAGVSVNTHITEKMHVVKFGLNYRFGFGGQY